MLAAAAVAAGGTPTPTPGGSMTYPTDLGAKLRMLWDAEGAGAAAPVYDPTIKVVSSWRETVTGLDFVRLTGASNTVDGYSYYAAGAVGSHPGVKAAGLTSYAAAAVAKLSLPFEVWATVYYATDSASVIEPLFAIEDTAGTAGIMLGGGGLIASATATFYVSTSSGSTMCSAAAAAGVHVVRFTASASGISVSVDGGTAGMATNAAWPASLTGLGVSVGGLNAAGTSYRFNADGSDAAKKNAVNILAVTDALTTTEAADMLAFMSTRKV